MPATAQPGAVPPGAYGNAAAGPAGWGAPPWASNGRPDRGFDHGFNHGFNPWAFVWSVPKPLLIAAMVLGFIAFWPIGLAVLFFLIGSGRIGGRWSRRYAANQAPGPWAMPGGCGWRGWARQEAPASGNRAFDEYRQETLRRLEEEQREFGEFLERLRVAKDKAEFDQFMAERRQRPASPPPAPEPPAQG
ncbi:DUF2852 domain-containing protein [Paracraurococcus lichenis]|uniref:DUF2852 domain-containing protein n=1 Tax=Paracraurococcus lichenis TaxID=3064888 RepID=A0ABT9E4J1_9PROT|nr:DUF2852 domain-containing protein [Paracraurococcus sp. LOR1-02]MDO9711071.1 DUF2852 domain-containing protein [Paracraurococcus sp. LOR1-02]